MKFTVVF